METKENLKERLKHQVMERMDISRTMEDEEILELVGWKEAQNGIPQIRRMRIHWIM